jgi:hypothetical protein
VGEILGYHGGEYENVRLLGYRDILVEVDRRFIGAYCLHHYILTAQMTEVVRTSETSVYFYETTKRCAQEGSRPQSKIIHRFL